MSSSTLLPVLQQNHPNMSLCSICPKPGHCCHGFVLQGESNSAVSTEWEDSWREDALARMRNNDLPFLPFEMCDGLSKDENGREYGWVRLTCPKLINGRCSIYETRPTVCRTYVPGESGICVFHGIVS